jgi:uncharacterized membrane protein YuzA (DUF378 family)
MATMTERRHMMDRRSTTSGNISSHTSHRSMSVVDGLAMTLLIVGGINWGLIGLFNFDLVATLFGEMTPVSRLVYILVGFSALYSIYTASKMSKHS